MAALRPRQKERLRERAGRIGQRQTRQLSRQTGREIGRTQRQTSRRMAGQQRVGARQQRSVNRIGLGGLQGDDRQMLQRELAATSRAIPKITDTLSRGYRKEGRQVVQGLRQDLRAEQQSATQSAFGELRTAAIDRAEEQAKARVESREDREALKDEVRTASILARQAIEKAGAPVTTKQWRDWEVLLAAKDGVSPEAARVLTKRLKQKYARKDTSRGREGLRGVGSVIPGPVGQTVRALGRSPALSGLAGVAGRSASQGLSRYLQMLRENAEE